MNSMDYRKLRGMHFIRVRGNNRERIRAHGGMLRSEIADGAVPALAKKNEWLIRRAHGLTQFQPLSTAIIKAYRNILLPYLGSHMTSKDQGALKAAAKASGLSYEVCRECLFQPEAMMFL